ncbi:MAG: hypothetical protein QOG53_2565 [Frankiales bacterium]|jgi:hypothetical protein|nr:hypothetical protein [Frankiales bacterium]
MNTLRGSRPVAAPDTPEWQRIVSWRYDRLLAARFPAECAHALATSRTTDLHALLALVDRGCPPGLAARILDNDESDYA